MNSENTTRSSGLLNFSFEIDDSTLAAFTHLKLFNGYNEIVSQGYGNMHVQVPKGIYQLRVEMNEHVEDRDYRITEDIADRLNEINTSSATPLAGIRSTHEYFSGPSTEWSKKATDTGKYLEGSSIFIFLRYSDQKKPFDQITTLAKGFSILNESREIVFSLNEDNTKSDSGEHTEFYGCIAFHAPVDAGQYYLLYKSKTLSREIPLYVFENWQTQIFMMVKDLPLFATVRISIERLGFSWQNAENIQLDALIQKMYNGIYILPDSLKEAAAQGKWENPMLGIISCYMYLMSSDSKDDVLFETMLTNLEYIILNNRTAPDLVALRLLSAVHFRKPIPEQALHAPSMVSAGMNIFLKQSLQNEKLIKKGSIVEKIFKNIRADSIWSTYDPLPIKRDIKSERKITKTKQKDAYAHISIGRPGSQAQFNPGRDWVTSTIFGQLSGARDEPSIETLATQLQITSNTVRSTLTKMNKSGNLSAVVSSILGDDISFGKMDDKVKSIQEKIDILLK